MHIMYYYCAINSKKDEANMAQWLFRLAGWVVVGSLRWAARNPVVGVQAILDHAFPPPSEIALSVIALLT